MKIFTIISAIISVLLPLFLLWQLIKDSRNSDVCEYMVRREKDSFTNSNNIRGASSVNVSIKNFDNAKTTQSVFYLYLIDKPPAVISGKEVIIVKGKPCVNLNFGTTIFGRDEDADVLIHDSYMSRLHFSIRIISDGAFISDLGSGNGTYVNGNHIAKDREILPGDEINAGTTKLKFLLV